jgi:hypothetical protein
MSSKDTDTKRYESKDGYFTIFAVFEGNYVRWSREEDRNLYDEDISTVGEFEKMLQEEEWREVTS